MLSVSGRIRDLLRGRPSLRLGSNVATLHGARRGLEHALARQDERRLKRPESTVAIQLLGQVTPAVEWPKLLVYWERRNPSGVAGWPRRLEPRVLALNLWPLPAARVGRAAAMGSAVRKRQPTKLLCTPGLTTFSPDNGGDAMSALTIVCATWLENVAATDFPACRLAPRFSEQIEVSPQYPRGIDDRTDLARAPTLNELLADETLQIGTRDPHHRPAARAGSRWSLRSRSIARSALGL